MNITLLLIIVSLYFLILLCIAYFTSKKSDNLSFFIGNRKSVWWLVAFGMIGTSLSGVTFVSVPGTVGNIGSSHPFNGFEYFQLVIGNFLGYLIITTILLPLYYKFNLTSIYSYLGNRFNNEAHKTGSIFFIISRSIGATARVYLAINILQIFLLDKLNVPFVLTTTIILSMILLYTLKGGVKTIVVTDTLQTFFMLLSLVICIYFIMTKLNLNLSETIHTFKKYDYWHIFNFDFNSKSYFLKYIIGGAFITIAMSGLDQEMMQKNISVKNSIDSRKNMLTFSFVSLCMNFLFLFLGGLLYLFAINYGAEYFSLNNNLNFGFSANENIIGDDLFPSLALGNLFPGFIGIIFIIGLISALFPSADGAITSITSSFCVDIINLQEKTNLTENKKKQIRMSIHLIFTLVFLILILIFKYINNKSIIYVIMDLAGYTYGPLLGLFSFGILTKRYLPKGGYILTVAILSPIICWVLKFLSEKGYLSYSIGLELILINGIITFLGLLLISKRNSQNK